MLPQYLLTIKQFIESEKAHKAENKIDHILV